MLLYIIAQLLIIIDNFSGEPRDLEKWLEAAAGAIVDIFRLNDSDEIMEVDDEEDSSTRNNTNKNNSKRKFNSIWIIPYLVKNLKFLQSRVLKVSTQILEFGPGPKPAAKPSASGRQHGGPGSSKKDTSNMSKDQASTGHQPFLQLILTCLRELGMVSHTKCLVTCILSKMYNKI